MTTFLKTLQQDIELLYRSVFESTLEGMEIIDGETCRVVTANQAMANIFGFASPEEMVGLNPLDNIPTEDRDRVARMIDEDMFQNNLRLVTELRATTRDGRELWLSALGVRIEHQGRLAGLISVRDITAQKLREKKIEASREETRLLVENAGKAIVVVQDGVIKFANSKTTELTGYPEKDLVSSPFTGFIHPDDQPTVAELCLRSLRGEEVPQGSIVRSIGKEGKVIWFGLKAVSFTWDEKPAVWLLMNDVTERKMAEDSLRESEKRYRLLAENASDVIWVTDMNMRPTYLSPSVTRLLGYSMEEAMARGMQESLTPASLKAATDAIVSALDAERKGQKDAMSMIPALELEMVRKDGSIVWVASTVSFISGPDGQPVEIMGVTRDITERKKTEEALQSNERHFRALIENSSDAIIVVNRDGTNRYVSSSTGRMLGYKPDERIGGSIFESVHPDDIQLASDEFVRLLQNPGATSFMEVRIQHKDGIWHTIEARATNLFHDPAVEGIVVNLRNVTERKKVEETLKESEERLRILFECAPDGYYLNDMEGTFVDGNRAAEELTGYKKEDLIGSNFLNLGLLSPEQLPRVAALLAQNIQGQMSSF
jgi:PAS domain S-box-containing protein